MNKTSLFGRLVRDPSLSTSQNQVAVTKFTLAVDRKMSKEKKKEAESKGLATADFIPIIVWGKKAELANQYLRKGSRLVVSGEIRTGSYKTQSGETRYTTQVHASDLDFIDFASLQQSMNNMPTNDYQVENAHIDDDIPF